MVRSVTDPMDDAKVQAVAAAIAATGDLDRGETVARSVPGSYEQVWVLASVATAVAGDDPGRARHLAEQAATVACSAAIYPPLERGQALAVVVGAVAATGGPDRAETIARSVTDSHQQQVRALTIMVEVFGDTDPGWARRLAGRDEALAHLVTDQY